MKILKCLILLVIVIFPSLTYIHKNAVAASSDPDIILNCSWHALSSGESPESCGVGSQSTYPMNPTDRQECLDNLHPVAGQNNNCEDYQSSIYPVKTADENKCSGTNPGNANCCCTYGAKNGCYWTGYFPELYEYTDIRGYDHMLDYDSPFRACGSNVPTLAGSSNSSANCVCYCGTKTNKTSLGQEGSISGGSKPTKTIFTPQVSIPGSRFQAGVDADLTEKSTTYIGQYVSAFYNYAMGIVGILAVIVLMIGGILWLTSAGNPEKISQAKQLIIGSITGTLLLLSAWIILNTINPDLIEFRITKITQIDGK